MQYISSKLITNKNKKIGFINFYSKNKRLILAFILILSFVSLYFLVDISSQSLIAHDEGLYARRSRLVEDSFNWFSSNLDNNDFDQSSNPHHKTIGSYWLIALSIRFFGTSELALRLPSILTSFLCLFISYLIAIKVANKKSALISVFSLSSMPLWLRYSRYASPDIPFVLCILFIVYFFLKFLESNQFKNKVFYIFISGIFISIAFFIRSFMVFVPLLGLSPFLLYHLLRSQNIFKIFFFTGILLGLIPTFFNIYFSYKNFGINAIITLFDFAKEKAIGSFDINNLLLLPLNYLYLTFPVGIFFIVLFVFTRSNNKINYPLLIYIYPLLSLAILLCMSNTYSHYYLFLLSPLSILFSSRLQSCSFRLLVSRIIISYSLLFIVLFISVVLIVFLLFYKHLFIDYSYQQTLLIYIVSLFLILSFISALRFVFVTKTNDYSLLKLFYSIIIPQYISISLLYNFGIIGNPNYQLKSFLNDNDVKLISNTNTIYLFNVDSKINTLLRYYLPFSKVLNSSKELVMHNYIITSDIDILNDYDHKSLFKSIKKFDKYFLLKNIRN